MGILTRDTRFSTWENRLLGHIKRAIFQWNGISVRLSNHRTLRTQRSGR
jgi:hypothetical protein